MIKEEEKEEKRWYELPILITVIGSMIYLIGNFCVSLAPTEDDFSISIDNVSMEAKLFNDDTYFKDNDLVRKKEGEFRGKEKSQMANDNGEFLLKAVPSADIYRSQISNDNSEFLPNGVPAARITVADINNVLRNYKQQVFIKALDCPSNIIIEFNPKQSEPTFDSKVYVSIKPNDSLLSKDNIITYSITIQGIGGDGKKRNCSAFIYFFPPKILVDLGNKKMEEKQYERALQAFEAAIDLNRSYAEAWYSRARAQYELGFEKYNSSKKHDEAVFKESNKKALDYLNEAIKLNNTYEDARFLKASVLYNLNMYNESLHECLTIIEQNNLSHTAWVNKGSILKTMGWYNESLLAYKEAFALNKDGYITSLDFYYLGRDASASNDYETALQAFDKAIEISPEDFGYWCEKTCILYQLGRLNESIEFADNATRKFKERYELINRESKLAYLWIIKSLALDGLGMHKEADNAYDMATNASSSSEYWRYLSWVLYKSNKYDESLQLANTAIKKDPNDGYSWLFKSLALESLGKHDESDVAYEKASVLIWPNINYVFSWKKIPGTDDNRLKEYLGWKYNIDWVYTARIAKSIFGKTIHMSKEAKYLSLTLNDDNSEVILKIDKNEIDKFKARNENGELNVYDKSGEIAWNSYAWTLYKLRKYNESLRLANKVTDVDPSSSESWDTKGAALIGLGNYREANNSLDKAISIKPYAMIYFHKAEALAGLGDTLLAYKFYSKAIEEEPDPFEGWYGRGNILKNLSYDSADEVLVRAKELKDNVKMRYNGWY